MDPTLCISTAINNNDWRTIAVQPKGPVQIENGQKLNAFKLSVMQYSMQMNVFQFGCGFSKFQFYQVGVKKFTVLLSSCNECKRSNSKNFNTSLHNYYSTDCDWDMKTSQSCCATMNSILYSTQFNVCMYQFIYS
jgi:hypothetical protein